MNAKEVLFKAVKCDTEGRILEAQELYQEGITILLDLKDKLNPEKQKALHTRILTYIQQAESIQKRVELNNKQGEVVHNTFIAENSTGHSYNSLFGKYLNEEVNEILIEEPYMKDNYQFGNLVVLLELIVKNCPKVKYIRLVTKSDSSNKNKQKEIFQNIKEDLKRRNIQFSFKFEENLHDRRIVLINGYIIKLGRGLHFYKKKDQFEIGRNDYDFRECLQTNVDIWRTNL